MKRVTMIYAVLFVIALGGAYASWTHEPEASTDDGVVLIDAKPDEIASVSYTTKDVDVTLDMKDDELGSYIWVTTERENPRRAPPADPNDPDAKPPEPVAETTKATFKAGSAGDQLLEELAPFRVSRSIQVQDDELDEFGFDNPTGTLTVATKDGQKRTFEIGATAYGHKNTYLRDAESNEVYVIKRSVVSPLDRADTRLPEKELFQFPVAEIERAVATNAEQTLEFVQRNRDDEAKSQWTAPDSDETLPTVDAWLDKVFRLRASSYTTDKAAGQFETAFAVKLLPEDGQPVTLEVLRGMNDKGETTWFARSQYTRGLVELNGNLAADAADDIPAVFGQVEE